MADANGCLSTKFYCPDHDEVDPFTLKELRAQVFDTYSICAALLTGLSASRFFFDNRPASEFLKGKGMHTTMHLSLMIEHIHILVASVCTAAGLESMLVFVLCAMYSRSSLAMPQVGGKVFEYFLSQTGKQRTTAFSFMLGCGIVSSFNVVINCLTMPTSFMTTDVPAVILDVFSVLCACLAMYIVYVTVNEVGTILGAASIIFVPQDKLDEWIQEQIPLTADRKEAMDTPGKPAQHASMFNVPKEEDVKGHADRPANKTARRGSLFDIPLPADWNEELSDGSSSDQDAEPDVESGTDKKEASEPAHVHHQHVPKRQRRGSLFNIDL